jgi:hypothetical protein
MLLHRLNESNTVPFHLATGNSPCAFIFTRFGRSFLAPRTEGDRFTFRVLKLPVHLEVLIMIVHLSSKMYWKEDSQAHECLNLSAQIREEEKRAGHSRTLLVGDFNMNPFEAGMISAVGLNATMCREIALRQQRNIQGRSYPFFYNPMWNHFGDDREGISGTYYYERNEHVNFYWNMFDQVLVRPDLIGRLPRDGVKILTNIGGVPLVSERGKPDQTVASDHLPSGRIKQNEQPT